MCGGGLVAAQAGEGLLVGGVEGLALLATATATTEVTAGSTTGSTTATAAASITTGTATARIATAGIATAVVAAGTATTTTATAAGALRLLDEAVLELELLGLGPGARPTPLLGSDAGEELLLLILGDGGEVLPLAVVDTLVGLADLEGALALESLLLLGQLDLVLVERDVVVLGLRLLGLALGGSLTLGLLLGFGNLGASLLVLKLSLALVGAPRLGSLLLRVAAAEGVSEVRESWGDG